MTVRQYRMTAYYILSNGLIVFFTDVFHLTGLNVCCSGPEETRQVQRGAAERRDGGERRRLLEISDQVQLSYKTCVASAFIIKYAYKEMYSSISLSTILIVVCCL